MSFKPVIHPAGDFPLRPVHMWAGFRKAADRVCGQLPLGG